MPYDPSQLPDLPEPTGLTPSDKFKKELDALARLLGSGFSFNNGLQYQNGNFTGLANQRGLEFKYPLFGGQISGSVRDIVSDPHYQLRYMKQFK